jgi:hypothetical protein
MKSTSVPFTIQNVFQGFAETTGILSVDHGDLKFEFQTSDNIVGLLKSGVQEVRLPLNRIEEITFRKGWLGCSLIIRVAELRGTSDIPNFKQGEILLSVAKRHSQAASDFVSTIQLAPGTGGNP